MLPSCIKEVTYAEVKDINFRPAGKLKAERDERIDERMVNVIDGNTCSTTSKSLQCTPTDKEIDDLFLKLNDFKTNS